MNFINLEGDLKQQSTILKVKIDNEKEMFKISLFNFFLNFKRKSNEK
jgi:hypothetical protein